MLYFWQLARKGAPPSRWKAALPLRPSGAHFFLILKLLVSSVFLSAAMFFPVGTMTTV